MNTEQKSNKRELITCLLREECGNVFECLMTLVERAVVSPDTTLENWEAVTKEKCKEISAVVREGVLHWINLKSPLPEEKLHPLLKKYHDDNPAL